MIHNIILDLTYSEKAVEQKTTDPKKISTMEEGAAFSKSIINLLKSKAKVHNSSNRSKVSLSQLKEVYINGSKMFSDEKSMGFLGLARVNTYLRILASEKLDVSLFKNRIGAESFFEIDLAADLSSIDEDLKVTEQEVLANDLDKNFNEDDLFIKEEEPIMLAETLRGLL